VIVAKVLESAPTARPSLDYVFIEQRFMSAVGNPEFATRDPESATPETHS